MLRVFENGPKVLRMLRRVFEVKRDEITGECVKLLNAELHALYSSPNNLISRQVKWVGQVAHMEQCRKA